MMASLFSGVSGLKNHQVKMNVIGNNIANVNTIGFKGSRVNFQEALVQTFKGAGRPSALTGGTNPVQLGLGMQVGTIDNLFQQGGLETTGQITDLAIQGNGFFVLGDMQGNRFFSRAGAFGFDADGALVDPATGMYVQGRMADNLGRIMTTSAIGRIVVPFGQQDPARETTEVTMMNNLDASASDSEATLTSAGTSNVNTVSGTAIDGVGGTHTLEIAGAQATQATMSGGGGGLTSATQLSAIPGLTVFDDFSIAVDGGTTVTLDWLTGTSTVQDLVEALNQIDGLEAELNAGNIEVTRSKAGVYTIDVPAGQDAGGIGQVIFGSGVGGATQTGSAHSFSVSNYSFVPTYGPSPSSTPNFGFVVDDTTGLVTGITGLGGGGIEISTPQAGLQAAGAGNELVIETDDTTHTTSLQVFDSLGQKHTLTVEFFKSAQRNRWEWNAATLGNETITGGGSGYVQFNPDGSLASFAYNGGASTITVNPNNGGANMNIDVNAGTPGQYDGLTGFGSGAHTAALTSQDGYGLGNLEKISIDQTGNVSGIFSNGTTRVLAQIMLADFNNVGGLRKAGKTTYQSTANSGVALEGVAGETISGTISSGALESSSVDISQEFTGMITAQRGFQANARIITTSDQMLDELVNIKR